LVTLPDPPQSPLKNPRAVGSIPSLGTKFQILWGFDGARGAGMRVGLGLFAGCLGILCLITLTCAMFTTERPQAVGQLNRLNMRGQPHHFAALALFEKPADALPRIQNVTPWYALASKVP